VTRLAEEKLAVRTANELERRIMQNRWQPGAVIGSEAQLLEEFGVSRAVLREAMLLLEQRQIAVRRRGNGGGVRVRRPDPSGLTRAVSLLLEFDGVAPEQIMETRILLEQRCVQEAVRRADLEDLGGLTQLAREGLKLKGEAARRQMGDFHLRLAKISGNPVWALFTQVLIQVAVDLIGRSGAIPSDRDIRKQFEELVHAAQTLIDLIAALEDNDDVQNVYANFEVSDDALAKFAA